jgi:hypothetical protein
MYGRGQLDDQRHSAGVGQQVMLLAEFKNRRKVELPANLLR